LKISADHVLGEVGEIGEVGETGEEGPKEATEIPGEGLLRASETGDVGERSSDDWLGDSGGMVRLRPSVGPSPR
jgi:hypothetical protein